jgi:hypothetical protein
MCEEFAMAGKHSLPGPLLRLMGPRHLTTDTIGSEAGGRPFTPLYPRTPSATLSLLPSLYLGKKGREKARQ